MRHQHGDGAGGNSKGFGPGQGRESGARHDTRTLTGGRLRRAAVVSGAVLALLLAGTAPTVLAQVERIDAGAVQRIDAAAGGSGGVSGGTAGRFTLWSGTSTVTSDAGFAWDPTLRNTFVGVLAGSRTNVRPQNTAVGDGALGAVAAGPLTIGYNTAVGVDALSVNTAGYNTAVGRIAGGANSTGQQNVFVGMGAGSDSTTKDNTTGSYNTFVGVFTTFVGATNYDNVTVLGYGAQASAANQVTLGNASVIDVQAGTGAVAAFKGAAVKIAGANGELWRSGYTSELITLSTSGTTTDSSANLLPENSVIEGVVALVTTTITTATDWKLGDGTTAGRFSAAYGTMTAGATVVGLVHVDQTGNAGPRQTAAAKLRITTTGTPGAGVVRVTVFYRQFVPGST